MNPDAHGTRLHVHAIRVSIGRSHILRDRTVMATAQNSHPVIHVPVHVRASAAQPPESGEAEGDALSQISVGESGKDREADERRADAGGNVKVGRAREPRQRLGGHERRAVVEHPARQRQRERGGREVVRELC